MLDPAARAVLSQIAVSLRHLADALEVVSGVGTPAPETTTDERIRPVDVAVSRKHPGWTADV